MPAGGKPYKNESPMKTLTLLGGIGTFIPVLLALIGIPDFSFVFRIPWTQNLDLIVIQIVGVIISGFTIIYAIKPGKILPFSFALILLFGILLMIFGGGLSIGEEFSFYPGILVLVAGVIGIFEMD